jgi:DNA-binding MarR family transcriptional regulator
MPYRMEDSLGFHVTKTANAMRNRFNAFLKPYHITSEQFVILKAIDENTDITPTQLAEIVDKDKTTLTRMLDTMVRNGYIERRVNESDRRSHTLAWSAKAQTLMEKLLPMYDDVIGKLRARFAPDELACFFKILNELQSIDCLKEL